MVIFNEAPRFLILHFRGNGMGLRPTCELTLIWDIKNLLFSGNDNFEIEILFGQRFCQEGAGDLNVLLLILLQTK